ncbi:26S proteasome regulatory subunit N8 [Nematocida parisii]|nr:26S proteasome regulatory subunit N8 [Nematocida parisii]KAI5128228.1 26S proteasome regulatory subunit N8 [Nematocida parisii]KAI5145269.1 26S proteasome regulatory subunit N8 [Nematocida parisii]KAI5155137.1 26S proteasome regulatory subunit N8 [Nematocida parisii]KAI5157947.1 26S proteasome regulatory subunit N8 [Nematocida parisii]
MLSLRKAIVVHPLVLLSATDHYRRMDQPRVVGTLLGKVENGVVHVTNSYAVPFDELEDNPNVWFFDTSYNENMYKLFNKVNNMESIIGWYHTGEHLHKNDLQITQTFRSYCKDPILAVINVENAHEGSPVKCYKLERESTTNNESTQFVFAHVPFEIEAEEAEEVGVEQLVEEIKDINIGDVENKICRIKQALAELSNGLSTIEEYLQAVENGDRPYDPETMNSIQELMNNIPRRIPGEMKEYLDELDINSFICATVRPVVLLNEIEKSK